MLGRRGDEGDDVGGVAASGQAPAAVARSPAVAPQHADQSMPWTAAPWTSWSRSPTITTCGPGRSRAARGRDHLGLGAPPGLERRPGERL